MQTLAINQYGEVHHNLGAHPRKALLDKLGYSRADKMYIDKKDGSTVHYGYIIGGQWLSLYTIEPLEKKA